MAGMMDLAAAVCRAIRRWKTPLVLVALLTSAAAFFASFSSGGSGGRLSFWYFVPSSFPAFSSLGGVSTAHPPLAPSPVTEAWVLAPSASPVPAASPLAPSPPLDPAASGLVPSASPVPTASPLAPSPSAIPAVLRLASSPSAVPAASPLAPAPSPTAISGAYASEVKQTNQWRERDLQLMYAKREIAAAPVIADDPDLCSPLYLNVSIFKRSYELMERILKVYIYEEGERPLFHTPELGGIYGSEGWFMRSMESNEQFVVKDPNKAHLFYLPYSSYQIRKHLYDPKTHSLDPISFFLRGFINSISSKYPFWNTTKGADHFFVACHDWATYTTLKHEELRDNAIKVVCNADVTEGIFRRGKDVSLPETYIRDPKHPRKGAGGKPAANRTILGFYAGQNHGRVRPVLLRYWQGKDPDLRIYGVLPPAVASRMSYFEHMKSSKFCICPMGYEVNSPRIVEAITYGCVPVVIADGFALPFEEVLDWAAFSVVVPERDIPRLKEVMLAIEPRGYEVLQRNVRRVRRHFLWNVVPQRYDLFHMILHSVWFNRLQKIQES